MANKKDITKDNLFTYSLNYHKKLKTYKIRCPRTVTNQMVDGTYDIYVDENKNIYFCRHAEQCLFCGRKVKRIFENKAVCRTCYQRLIEKQFDEVTDNAKTD